MFLIQAILAARKIEDLACSFLARGSYVADHFLARLFTRAGTPQELSICILLSTAASIRVTNDGSQTSNSSR